MWEAFVDFIWNDPKLTWNFSNSRTFNQIDHTPVKRKGSNPLKDVRLYRGADAGRDQLSQLSNFH